MRLYVDNYDGVGLTEYTRYVAADVTFRLKRALNAVSSLTVSLAALAEDMVMPLEHARVLVMDTNATTLFTGYVSEQPVMEYVRGVKRVTLHARSDEWLVDQWCDAMSVHVQHVGLADALQRLVQKEGSSFLDAGGDPVPNFVGVLRLEGETFSSLAASLAEAGGAAYRVSGGHVAAAVLGEEKHALDLSRRNDGTVSLRCVSVRPRATDVAVCGQEEPATCRTEMFAGDGVTRVFELSESPFSGNVRTLVEEQFQGTVFAASTWKVVDAGSYLSIGAEGLTAQGGNGYDGQTFLARADPVEMGANLVAVARGVTLQGISDGVLCGFFSGDVSVATCVAGIRLRQSGSSQIAVAIAQGVEVGTPTVLTEGHAYTVTVMLRADETYRLQQAYYTRQAGMQQMHGGGVVESSMRMVCDVRDEGLASNTLPTRLCDVTVPSAPALCTFGLLDNIQFNGTIRSAMLRCERPVWVTCIGVDGSERVMRIGTLADAASCSVSTGGAVTFFDGSIPGAGERVVVQYRSASRSVARVQDEVQIVAVQAATGLSGLMRWRGRVLSPPPRTSEDCWNAASALLALAVEAEESLGGECVLISPTRDLWPGDALVVTYPNEATQTLLVRSVVITDLHSAPEALQYEVQFANAWADDLSIRTSETLSEAEADATNTLSVSELATLAGLKVVGVTATEIQVDAGRDADSGGGFEVRRRDTGFGVTNSELVMRSTERIFSIARQQQVESFAIRMYDAETPPRFSRFAHVLQVDVPVE